MLTQISRGMLALALCLTAIAPHRPAWGQSDNDLRREREALRARVKYLEAELEAAQKKIAELQRLLEELRRAAGTAPAGTGPGPTAPAAGVTIDESVFNASPRALHEALVDSYQDAMAGMEPGEAEDRQHAAYLRALDLWARRVNREMRAQVTWHVRVERLPRPGTDERLELLAVDPETEVPLGDPFAVTPPRPVLQRLAQHAERGLPQVMVLRGVLAPEVVVNPAREEPGTFDKPRFIGPFAEYELSLTVNSVTPAPPRKVPPGH
jgi:hypothetical protein